MNDFTRHGPYLEATQRVMGDTAVTIRPVRPEDMQSILEMHQRLSSNSLYLRYLVPYLPDYIPAHLRDICTLSADQGAALVATIGAQVIGLGYYMIKPEQPDTAEPALLIEDRFQGQGIGSRLLHRLMMTARNQGVRFFDALTHSSNRPMLHLLRRNGRPIHSKRDSSHMAILLSLTTNDTAKE
jgi:GNAT superfamily N-acetyltransferase